MRRGIGRLRAGGGGIALPPSTGMVAWFRKGTGITSSSNAVSQWNDQSGNARHYTQATGAAQPILQAGGTIIFDGTSQFLATANFTLSQPFTHYLRIKQITWVGGRYIVDGASADSALIYQNSASPGIKAFAGTVSSQNSDLAVGAWGSVAVVFSGASSLIQVGANAAVSSDFGVGAAGGLTLAIRGDRTLNPSNIEVAEQIVYNVAHDATQRAAVIAYLNTL